MYRPFQRPSRPRKFTTTPHTTARIQRSFEPLEERHLLSASAVVAPLAAEYDYPVVDLNGDAAGIDYAATYISGQDPVPVGDVAYLDIHAATTHLQSVRLQEQSTTELFDVVTGGITQWIDVVQIDTSGTNIVAGWGGGFVLSGLDTVENYEKVLKSIRLTGFAEQMFERGLTLPIGVVATDSNGVEGPRAHHLMTIIEPGPPVLDLDGGSPGEINFAATFTVGGPPVAIVDSDDLSIQYDEPFLQGVRIEIGASGGMVHFDATGFRVTYEDNAVIVSGSRPVYSYENLLRTATYTATDQAPGTVVPIVFTLQGISAPSWGQSPAAVSYVTVSDGATLRRRLPTVDLTGLYFPGTGKEVTLYGNGARNQSLFHDGLITLNSHDELLLGATIAFDVDPGDVFVNTVGTAITAARVDNTLVLSGEDSKYHYARALESLTFSRLDLPRGATHRVLFSVTDANGTGGPATALVTVIPPPPNTIDPDPDPARDYFTTTYRVGDPAKSVVDPGLRVVPGYFDLVGDVQIFLEGGPGTLSVDASGTNVSLYANNSEFVWLHGGRSRSEYESVLRTLKFHTAEPGDGIRRVVMYLYDQSGQNTQVAEVLIAVADPPVDVGYDYPIVDLNGDAPGIDYASVEYYTDFPAFGISLGSEDVQVHSSTGYLQAVHFAFQTTPLGVIGGNTSLAMMNPDTSGTNIEVSAAGEFVLSGLDTVENYEMVIERIKLKIAKTGGHAYPLSVYAVDAQGVRGPQSQHLLTVVDPLPPVIDLPPAGSAPVVDINGPSAGTSSALTIYSHEGAANVPLFSDPIEIHSPVPVELTGARVEFDSDPGDVIVDTAGTGIQMSREGNTLLLSGAGSPQEYAQVLGSLAFVDLQWWRGSTHQVQFTVDGPTGMSPPLTALVTVLRTPGVLLDVDGDPDRDYFTTTYEIGSPPVSIVDAAGLTVTSPHLDTIWYVEIVLHGGPGKLSVDTTGTNINANAASYLLVMNGEDTLANYEKVLRTLKFETSVVGDGTRRVEIRLLDDSGQNIPLGESLIMIEGPLQPTVFGRHIFYNNSKFDQPRPFGNPDDAAMASKVPYFAGSGVATSAAVTSYVSGINGIMIDVEDFHGPITVDDFTFKIGNDNSPQSWTAAPAPSEFLVRPGEGIDGTDRIVIIWPDASITNTWLQVTLEGNDEAGGFNTNTGLAASDVFYFGNRIGDTFQNSSPAVFLTNASDQIAVRNNHGSHAWTHNVYDFNRDGLVNAADEIIARNNAGLLFRLNLPAPSVVPAAAAASNATLPSRALPDPSAAAVASALAAPQASGPGDVAELSRPTHRLPESALAGASARQSRPAASDQWRAVQASFSDLGDTPPVDEELLSQLLAKL